MHEIERHRIILGEVAEKPVVTVAELVELTGASEATIRRDIGALHVAGQLRRVRGGAEALHPPQMRGIAGRPFSVNEGVNVDRKRAIAQAAVELCEDGESIIINGGTTTFQMVHHLARRRMQILTNSFPIAEHLLRNSKNTITVPGGAIYREQNIILSPFDNDVTRNFYAHRMFMGAHGIGPLGVMEGDPLLIQAEQKLINQAEELVLLVDFVQVRKPFEPDPVPARARPHRHHRRRHRHARRQRPSNRPEYGSSSPRGRRAKARRHRRRHEARRSTSGKCNWIQWEDKT